MTDRNRICIAILALGGQGGGVLAGWIEDVAREHGWRAQATSVPGVAQRTGSTIYYVELAPADGPRPVMAQMPAPGDVDVVIASELMEAGRAALRGFCTPDRTTVISSTHRIYAISEKMAMGDGRASSERILRTVSGSARRFIGFDMETAADAADSVISSVMLGALAASGALPFDRADFEAAIRRGAIAVNSNLKGFEAGFDAALAGSPAASENAAPAAPAPTTPAGRALCARIDIALPAPARLNALHGVQRLMDYQNEKYARLYLERLESVATLDAPPYELTAETARHLALWMSYEDTIRVADLKTRGSRAARVRDEVRVQDGQILKVTEFMHPRLQEICETLPAPVGRSVLASKRLKGLLETFFRKGRHVETTRLRWFLALRLMAGLRPARPATLRYQEEQARIEEWLGRVRGAAKHDRALALEIVRCQRLIKGYGDTFERGLRSYSLIMAAQDEDAMSAAQVSRLRDLALADENGDALKQALARSA